MLLHQERAFAERWYSRKPVTTTMGVLRVIGVILSLVGLALCVLLLTQTTRQGSAATIGFALCFAGLAVVFYCVPRLTLGIRAWSLRRSENRCRRRAKKFFRAADALAPYEAEYDIKGELLTYAKGKDGKWQHGWHRNLGTFRDRGLALQSASLTALFRRPSSFLPAVIVLQTDPAWLGERLREFSIAVSSVSSAFSDGKSSF